MIRDNEEPAEEQCEISPSPVILHTSPFPGDISHTPPPSVCLSTSTWAPGKQDISPVSPDPRRVAAHSRASISVFIVD